MAILNFFKGDTKKDKKTNGVLSDPKSLVQPESLQTPYEYESLLRHKNIIYDSFDGEKTPGELGDIYDTVPDYLGLRLRAYDLNLKTDIIKVITGKFFKWVVGSGLKLQAEPNETVLGLSGINEDFNLLQKNIEALFDLYADSKYGDYNKNDDLHQKGADAFDTSFLGGDCLCIIRVDKYGPNIQVIDGQQVESPLDDKRKGKGNIIRHGIEMDKKGEHIAFWVRSDNEDSTVEHERVKAVNSNGNTVAWMIYGKKARVDHHRGIPVISSILEKVSKLDRYVEASVSKAEQTANVVYSFEHDSSSTGENILSQNLSSKRVNKDDDKTAFEKSQRTAHMLRQSTSGTVMNLTPGSKLNSLSNPSETQFSAFFKAVFIVLCASVDIPEEVALQKYDQNYSSSRAAINGWEFLVEVYRVKFAKKFYRPFYRVWLEYNILTDKIKSPGFLKAKNNGDFMALEAFYKARFMGKKMPHIDPLKETKAIRSMLGDNDIPLISYEQAAENLGAGDWKENYKKYKQERGSVLKEHEHAENKIDISGPKLESES